MKDDRRDAAKSSHDENDNYCGVNDRKLVRNPPLDSVASRSGRRPLPPLVTRLWKACIGYSTAISREFVQSNRLANQATAKPDPDPDPDPKTTNDINKSYASTW